jgi:hypothetical protein
MRYGLVSISAAIILAFALTSAQAQQATRTPAPTPSSGLPEKALPGWDQSLWTSIRNQCAQFGAEMEARRKMTPEQRRSLPALTAQQMSLSEMCMSLSLGTHARPYTPGSPLATPELPPQPPATPFATPTPQPPLPPPPPPPDSSSLQDPIPGVIFQAPGASGLSACSPLPAGGQPPDVAADISPGSYGENAQLLNSLGLYVYNKSGNLQFNESLESFWCGTPDINGQYLPGCNTTPPAILTDPQIAFDGVNGRWLATTLAYDHDTGQTVGVYFGATTSVDAEDTGGNWNRWSLPVCSTSYPFGDQPALGFSADWVAIDVICLPTATGGLPGPDTVLLIPNDNIVNPPQTLSVATPSPTPSTSLFAWRPSRDVLPSDYPYLMLAASDVPLSAAAIPQAALAEIDSNGTLTNLPNSPSNGEPGLYNLPPAPQQGCTTLSSGCEIRVGDARITDVTIQEGTDGKHYLLTSFPTEAQVGNGEAAGSQIVFFLDQLESGSWSYRGISSYVVNPGVNSLGPSVFAYPGIASDQILDQYLTFTIFDPSADRIPSGITIRDLPLTVRRDLFGTAAFKEAPASTLGTLPARPRRPRRVCSVGATTCLWRGSRRLRPRAETRGCSGQRRNSRRVGQTNPPNGWSWATLLPSSWVTARMSPNAMSAWERNAP